MLCPDGRRLKDRYLSLTEQIVDHNRAVPEFARDSGFFAEDERLKLLNGKARREFVDHRDDCSDCLK
jgi:hypothetical protein